MQPAGTSGFRMSFKGQRAKSVSAFSFSELVTSSCLFVTLTVSNRRAQSGSDKVNEGVRAIIPTGVTASGLGSKTILTASNDVIEGSTPENLFFSIRSAVRSGNEANSEGTTPVKMLSDKVKSTRDFNCPNSGGMAPWNLFFSRFSDLRLVNVAISVGRGPSSWLLPRDKIERFAKFSILDGT